MHDDRHVAMKGMSTVLREVRFANYDDATCTIFDRELKSQIP